jgi:hypothetical protein
MQQLNMSLGEHIRDHMRSIHAKFHEFGIHRKVGMNLSLFSFYEIYTIGEHEPRRFECMTMKAWFKGFKRNLFHIFVSYIFFVMDVQSPCINRYKQGIASFLTEAHGKGLGAGHADLRGIVWGGNGARGRLQGFF